MLEDEISLSHYHINERLEHHMETLVTNSREGNSTPPNEQFVSRVCISEVQPIIDNNDEEEKKTTSLVKVKDFEDYVRRAVYSGLLNKQYKVGSRERNLLFNSYVLTLKGVKFRISIKFYTG